MHIYGEMPHVHIYIYMQENLFVCTSKLECYVQYLYANFCFLSAILAQQIMTK